MAITAKITEQPKSNLKLDISIDAENVNKAFDNAYKDLVNKVKIKGFRPGKVPVGIVKKKYGDSVTHEVLENLLNESFRETTEKNDIHPVSQGRIVGELEKLEENKDFKFAIEVDVFPKFELAEYKNLNVTKNTYDIKSKDIDNEIDNISKRFAEIKDKEDNTANKDSLLQINFDVEFNGEIIEKLCKKNYSYDNSIGASYPDLKKDLIGKKTGEKLNIKSSFPKEFPDKDKAGKNVIFKVEIVKVQERVLPEINDEFVKKISAVKTVEEFKENLKKNMETHAKLNESRTIQNDLIEQLYKKINFEIPESMVQAEIESMLTELKHSLLYSNTKFEDYLKETGKTEEEIRETYREPAEKQVAIFLILNEIGKKEDLKIEEKDINSEIELLANKYNQTVEQMKEHLIKHNEFNTIVYGLRRRKTLELLENSANVKQGKKIPFSEISK